MKGCRWGTILLVLGAGCLLSCAHEQVDSSKPGRGNVIRVGTPFKAGHILVEAGEKFKELLEKESGGRYAVEVQAAAGSEEQINEWCGQGKIEMQAGGHLPLELYAPQYFFFNTPFVMKGFDHLTRVWNGNLGKKARELTEKNGNIKYLGLVYQGLRQTTAGKPIFTPADVYTTRLRLPTVKTWIAVWQAIGASPVAVPLPGLRKALREGSAEASEGDLAQIASFMLDDVQSHLIVTNHLVQTGGMMINKRFFDGLPREDQQMILKASAQACQWANEKVRRGEGRILVDLQRKGMHVIVPDAESFRARAHPAVEGLFKMEWPVATWAEILAE